jgi:ABC-type polysaccharide/polyol phosphate transport system ATPase subunit
LASVTLNSVTVDLPIYTASTRSLRRSLASFGVGGRLRSDSQRHVSVRALDDVSLSLRDGERLGVVGLNGAGKSTLLRVVGGLLEPTSGSISVTGQVSTLLSVDALMDPEMTGEENVEHVSALIHLSPHRGRSLMEDVASFSELGDFLKLPVRTYSAGMRVRLSFALMTAQNPDILVLDEAISAGDETFANKAGQRFLGLTERTRIIVLACHSKPMLETLCDRVLWMERGRIRACGPVDDVLEDYSAHMRSLSDTTSTTSKARGAGRA